MKRIAAVLMLAVLSLAAQDNQNTQSKPPDVVVKKLFVLKYADPQQVANLVVDLAGGRVRANAEMRAIAVTADRDAMSVIEDAIKQLDVPSAAPKNIELTVNLIVGTDAESTLGSPVPKELESVVAQLKGAFPFKNYRQVDQIELRTRTGERAATRSEGAVVTKDSLPPYVPEVGPARPQATTVTTYFVIRAAGLAPDGSTVRLDGMEASISWAGIGNNLTLNASVDVKEGQKVVVGRIGVSHDQALFVVLTAHVVQ
jgi:hypothetical protein